MTTPHRSTDLSPLLAPRTIAVIGASSRAGTMGHQILECLVTCGFTGAVYPVNPAGTPVCSVRAYRGIGEIPDAVDMAMIVVPKEGVLEVAEQCGAAHVKGLIVISAGFREIGEEGARREARPRGNRSPPRHAHDRAELHGRDQRRPGGLDERDVRRRRCRPSATAAFVSQSGALGMSVLDYAREYGIGISQFVSVGNKPDVSGNDLLVQWENDPAVRVILMYVENFGNPRRFLEIASRITKRKPIIVVKSGRSQAGARAATSHTGALAATTSPWTRCSRRRACCAPRPSKSCSTWRWPSARARCRVRGARRCSPTPAAPAFSRPTRWKGADFELAELSRATVDAIRPLFPPEASIRNPLDMIASATPQGYEAALTALLADPGVDAVVPIFVPPFGVKQEHVAQAIVAAAATQPAKPVLAVLMGTRRTPAGARGTARGGNSGVHLPGVRRARAARAQSPCASGPPGPPAHPVRLDADRAAAAAIIDRARLARREKLTEMEALDLLRAYGVPAAESRLVAAGDDLTAAARELGFPLAMKLVSADVSHKTDVGGVRLGIATEAGLLRAREELARDVRERAANAAIDGVLLQRMVSGGRETIAGITRRAEFGPLIMFGLGGIFVEAIQDVVFRIAPVDAAEALEMVTSIRGTRVLTGLRGAPPCDLEAIATVLRRIGQLALDFPQIRELDVNPLMAMEHGVIAVDARVRLATDSSETAFANTRSGAELTYPLGGI